MEWFRLGWRAYQTTPGVFLLLGLSYFCMERGSNHLADSCSNEALSVLVLGIEMGAMILYIAVGCAVQYRLATGAPLGMTVWRDVARILPVTFRLASLLLLGIVALALMLSAFYALTWQGSMPSDLEMAVLFDGVIPLLILWLAFSWLLPLERAIGALEAIKIGVSMVRARWGLVFLLFAPDWLFGLALLPIRASAYENWALLIQDVVVTPLCMLATTFLFVELRRQGLGGPPADLSRQSQAKA